MTKPNTITLADADAAQMFEPGQSWYSTDGGKTWLPGRCPDPTDASGEAPTITVIFVDTLTGIVRCE